MNFDFCIWCNLICRLFGFGIGIHLLEAENPEKLPKKKEINPKDNHISFQVTFLVNILYYFCSGLKIENENLRNKKKRYV